MLPFYSVYIVELKGGNTHTDTPFVKRIQSYCMNNVVYFKTYCGYKGKYFTILKFHS